MSPCLEDCPPEVIETVVSLLDFGDICRLRLTWRSLAAKSSHLCFKAFFRSKRVLFSEASLGALRDVTQPGRLGCLLEDLVLVGLANGQGMASSEADESADEAPYDLLRHAFRNLKANSKGRELLSLSLQVKLLRNDGAIIPPFDEWPFAWRRIWRSSARTFRVALRL